MNLSLFLAQRSYKLANTFFKKHTMNNIPQGSKDNANSLSDLFACETNFERVTSRQYVVIGVNGRLRTSFTRCSRSFLVTAFHRPTSLSVDGGATHQSLVMFPQQFLLDQYPHLPFKAL